MHRYFISCIHTISTPEQRQDVECTENSTYKDTLKTRIPLELDLLVCECTILSILK